MKHSIKSLFLSSALLAIAGFTGAAQASVVNVTGTNPAGQSVSFNAGTYSISVIDNSAAVGGYNGWTYQYPVSNPGYREAYTYSFGTTSITYDVSTGGSLGYYTNYLTGAAAVAAFAKPTLGYAVLVNGAYQGSVSQMTMTIAADNTLVNFAVPDYKFDDNSGGVSLSINRVPEPESVALVFAGLGALAITTRRRKAS